MQSRRGITGAATLAITVWNSKDERRRRERGRERSAGDPPPVDETMS